MKMKLKINQTLNASTAKQQYAFAKSARFPKLETYTDLTNPEPKESDFDKTVKTARTKDRHSFGSRQDRFRFSFTPKSNELVGP